MGRIMYGVIGVLSFIMCFVGVVSFLGYFVPFVICKDKLYLGVSVVGLMIAIFGLWGVSIYHRHVYSPEVIKGNTDEEYQKLLTDVDKANKELQKFYIDHPEYKLEVEEFAREYSE